MDLETLIREDKWPHELANLAREIFAMKPGRERFMRIPELDDAIRRSGLSVDAYSRLMCWQATWPDVKMITNDIRATEWGATYADKPPITPPKEC